jgi:hypothetical protein
VNGFVFAKIGKWLRSVGNEVRLAKIEIGLVRTASKFVWPESQFGFVRPKLPRRDAHPSHEGKRAPRLGRRGDGGRRKTRGARAMFYIRNTKMDIP